MSFHALLLGFFSFCFCIETFKAQCDSYMSVPLYLDTRMDTSLGFPCLIFTLHLRTVDGSIKIGLNSIFHESTFYLGSTYYSLLINLT